ncbi:MAG: hypothetical protein KJP14_04300 [Eudoraea sp.]|nr:hypothetical protein [Eudoraea sp.]MBT8209727.1 hypothetical protein [Eudoraea sp.]NNK30515.1 hypothetical protein [Flavobacteriaceae bacterium]
MKRLILAVVMLTGFLLTAQEGDRFRHKKGAKDMTPEQLATLKTKKLTLALDLTEVQQKEIQKLTLEQAKLRESKRSEMQEKRKADPEARPSKEERYEHQLARLDEMIAHKAKMKDVLTEVQFEKWERLHKHKKNRPKSKRKGHNHRGR